MSGINIQDEILNAVRRDNVPVTIYLLSGFQLRGVVKAFDNYVIVVEVDMADKQDKPDKRTQMIYKHAVSTIVPTRQLKLDFGKFLERKDK